MLSNSQGTIGYPLYGAGLYTNSYTSEFCLLFPCSSLRSSSKREFRKEEGAIQADRASCFPPSPSANTWFLIFGSVFIGISAGFFWVSGFGKQTRRARRTYTELSSSQTAEASIYIGYPEPGKKGRYLAQWAFWKNIAPAVGGAGEFPWKKEKEKTGRRRLTCAVPLRFLPVSLGVNSKTRTGGAISAATYIVFIVIMCLVSSLISPSLPLHARSN